MADNVKFLKGSLASLEAMTTSTKGAFYLTEDVPRLYYGTGSGAPLPVNEQITVVDAIADLPSPARAKDLLYYAKQENILCISKTDKSGWIQINPDTNDGNDGIHNFTISEPYKKENDDNWYYNLEIIEEDKNGTVLAPTFKRELKVTPEMIADLAVEVSLGIGSTAISSNATIVSLNGVGANSANNVKISGGDNVTLSGTANNITIAAKDTTYTLEQDATTKTKVVLKDMDGTPEGSVEFKAGEKLNVTAADGTIIYTHDTIGVAGSYGGTKTGGTTNQQTVPVVNITTDAYGHITAASTQNITVKNNTYRAHSINAKGADLSFQIADQDGTLTTATKEDVLYYKITVDGTEKTVDNQSSLGSFYSASKIDEKLQGLDAFTYKGTVGTGGTVTTLPTSKVSIGDTYKATADGTYKINGTDVYLHAGDIIIANGTEGADGYITSITWDVIHSENNTDTTYTLTAANNKIILEDSDGNTDNLSLAGDGVVTLTSARNTISAGHATSGVTAGTYGGAGASSMDYGDTIQVPQITVDANGHITAAATKNYKLPVEHEYDFEADVTNDILYITEDSTRKGSLTFKDDGTHISVNLTSSDTNDGILTVSHNAITRTNTTSAAKPDYGNNFKVITSVASDTKGHITGVNTATITLPSKVAYTLSGATLKTVTGGVSVTDVLTDANGNESKSIFNLVSNTLSITGSGSTITAELVWGKF